MIGQEELLSILNPDKFRALTILFGEEGSGKKTLLKEVLANYNYYIVPDTKKETIKEVVNNAYKVSTLMFYIIPEADEMSNAAMNSLLKVTEEPPNNAKFILTCNNEINLLPTLKSRAISYYMKPYSSKELLKYYKKEDNKDFIVNICENPGMINDLLNYNIEDFKNYVKLVYDNIDSASLANALKIGNKLSLKEGQEGYDLRLFFKAYIELCKENYINTSNKNCLEKLKLTTKYLDHLIIKGVNKSALFDIWVIEIKEIGGKE